MVIRHCAPTLASIRTGSLFSCPCESEKEVLHGVQELNRRLGGKGLRVLHRRRIAMAVSALSCIRGKGAAARGQSDADESGRGKSASGKMAYENCSSRL